MSWLPTWSISQPSEDAATTAEGSGAAADAPEPTTPLELDQRRSDRLQGIDAPPYLSPQARYRRRQQQRSNTPSPTPAEENRFNFPPTAATMDEATLQRVMEAAMRAANSNATAQVQSLRKPELPQFDKSNIEIWIRRVESAYARVRVTDPKLKFAHLESKFDVNTDPIINEFLFNADADADTWNSFLSYLRKRYGRTTKQEALSVINGTPREGRTPSQLVAAMKEKAGKVTLDDVLKEQLLKELPAEVHRQIIDKVDGLNFEQTGELADKWFDKEGRPLLSTAPSTVHSVSAANSQSRPSTPSSTTSAAASASGFSDSASFTAPFDEQEDETDVNAIRFRQGQKQKFRVQNGSAPRGNQNGGQKGNQGGNQRNGNGSRPPVNNNSSSNAAQKKVCPFHIKYGQQAERCLPWCMLYPQHTPKGKASQ